MSALWCPAAGCTVQRSTNHGIHLQVVDHPRPVEQASRQHVRVLQNNLSVQTRAAAASTCGWKSIQLTPELAQQVNSGCEGFFKEKMAMAPLAGCSYMLSAVQR